MSVRPIVFVLSIVSIVSIPLLMKAFGVPLIPSDFPRAFVYIGAGFATFLTFILWADSKGYLGEVTLRDDE